MQSQLTKTFYGEDAKQILKMLGVVSGHEASITRRVSFRADSVEGHAVVEMEMRL